MARIKRAPRPSNVGTREEFLGRETLGCFVAGWSEGGNGRPAVDLSLVRSVADYRAEENVPRSSCVLPESCEYTDAVL